MICPNCQRENRERARFCRHCGQDLQDRAMNLDLDEPQVAFSPSSAGGELSHAAPEQVAVRQPSKLSAAVGAAAPLPAASVAALGFWSPFAGHGTRGRYVSWLMDDLGDKAEALDQAITERFGQRQIGGARMRRVRLTAKGIAVEQRPYYFVQRGITTVALYTARFGRDLFISQVTYAKGPFSNVRVLVLTLMLLFQAYYVIGYSSSLANSIEGLSLFGGRGDFGAIIFYTCIIGPLGLLNTLALGFALVFSVYKWLKERDFFSMLRIPPDEFHLDDIVALEKAVEETVRQSLDAVGISMELMTPRTDQSFVASRLRII